MYCGTLKAICNSISKSVNNLTPNTKINNNTERNVTQVISGCS